MTTIGEAEHRSSDDEHGTKALWAAIDGLEHRFKNLKVSSSLILLRVRCARYEIRDGRIAEHAECQGRDREIPRDWVVNQREMGQLPGLGRFRHFDDSDDELERRGMRRTSGADLDDDFEA
ncbi:LOW QUALITY PROTEIN: hypothetical protein TorRG33x02_284720 [Trema orientale]|uniref:Uncharacterized protein n=1 Tax=Trema orientale TaxID=63057 RepID=A0A2P5CHK9_TREOI|nr:LOW QUALITY PROTEIN: hypothetical protein TorRG33x02_284720 [Trema orientale]